MKKKLIGFMLTFTMMFSLFPGLSVMAKDECNESGTSDLGTIADLTEDENISFTIKKGTLYFDATDMDGDNIYVMSVMP